MFTPPSSLWSLVMFWIGSLFLVTMPSDYIVSASSSATTGVALPRHHDHATPTMEESSINTYHQDAYALIATAVSKRLLPTSTSTPPSDQLIKIRNALKSLSSAQGALKKIDGISHEAYQRTHRSSSSGSGSSSKSTSDKTFDSETDGKVSGRATRSANRVGCAADAFLACELSDYLSSNCDDDNNEGGGTLVHRQVLLNDTMTCPTNNKGDGSNTMKLKVMVLYEHEYNGGNGLNHGGIDNLLQQQSQSSSQQNSSGGRILVIISNTPTPSLPSSMEYLDEHPLSLTLSSGLVGNEVASVHGGLWRSAGKLLELIAPVLNRYAHGGDEGDDKSNVAIHFVGHSLAGGVAGLAAAILDGALPMPNGSKSRRGGRRNKRGGKAGKRSKAKTTEEKHKAATTPTFEQQSLSNTTNSTATNNTTISMEGFGQGRSSAVALGPPPCLSPNVRVEFVTSIIYGDDVICRTTKDSFDRLCRRTENTMNKGILGKKMGWMGDAVSLTVSSLKSHAAGSEGEETRLSIPGKTYLIRPRRLDNICSMHEILTSGGSGREAMRASVLWQLDNVLLSKSLWIHHDLGSYIRGLDRVQLRSFSLDDDDDEE